MGRKREAAPRGVGCLRLVGGALRAGTAPRCPSPARAGAAARVL